MSKYFKYVLIAAFICTVCLIIFLQFNSTQSINQLINGDEQILEQTRVRDELQQLEINVTTLESKVRGAVISGTSGGTSLLDREINSIQTAYQNLSQLQTDSNTASLYRNLNGLLQSKIAFNRQIVTSYTEKGKIAAESLISKGLGFRLTDTIKTIISSINSSYQNHVTALVQQADRNGKKTRGLGTAMALIAIITSVFAFIFITNKVKEQQQLINRLNISEKETKAAMQVKENFLANMSHEIRTPMNAILGFTNLLQKEPLSDKSKSYVQTIQQASENLLTIINDILDLSKIEAGMMRIEPASFSPRSLLHDVEGIFLAKIEEKGLQLHTRVDENLPETLEGDTLRLTQVLTNLVGNAIKFTKKGNIYIRFINEGIEGNTVHTGIEVQDEGIGIEPEKLASVFNRFEQAETSVTRKYGGTGLGLSIVANLVQLQGGSINVESYPGKGTNFKLVIPYKIAAEQVSKKVRKDKAVALENTESIRVLVAEDNEINQSLIRHLFAEWHIVYDIASDGQQAIELLKKNTYHLVLMDIQMPEMDGYTAATVIRNDLRSTIPIIAMTAHAMAGEREKCLSYGMNEYISKPIREEQLHKLITGFTKNILPAAHHHLYDNSYQYINLTYMKEVSRGNLLYEKTVTRQFIETIPNNLTTLKKAWKEQDITLLQQTAHNMKTTISVMGLNNLLNVHLDFLEAETLTATGFDTHFTAINNVCTVSIAEANTFLTTLI